MFAWFQNRRRERIRARPLPEDWTAVLEGLPVYRRLPEADRAELRGHVQVLLEEKRFEGCGGLELTDRVRVTIGGQAAILLLHRDTDYYPQLESILVYPHAYTARSEHHLDDYLIEEGTEIREGESWYRGAIVLSWEDVQRGASGEKKGQNVVFHEFAHQLDDESGVADGTPVLKEHHQWRKWVRVFQSEYESLQEAGDEGRGTVLDPYGSESPAEFFAVATECFFERSHDLHHRHGELYDQLRTFYEQDPARW